MNYKAMERHDTYVPTHMREGFRLWFENGISPGSFGMAVLSNDLKNSFGRADHININHIGTIVAWLYNYAPLNSWGSAYNVKNWKGLNS